MEWLADPETWLSFITLAALEIVLGVDNVIFISILASKLPLRQQKTARRSEIGLAVMSRILLLLSLSWIIGLTKPLFTVSTFEVSGRDLVLLCGGLFLIGKATSEIHLKLEGADGHSAVKGKVTFESVLIQVLLLDVVFSLDSVITAVGIAEHVPIMIAAMITAAALMIVLADLIGKFCRISSDSQNVSFSLPASDWLYVGCRKLTSTYPQRLYLLRNGLFGVCGNAQFAREKSS